jgi:hypothetical protein
LIVPLEPSSRDLRSLRIDTELKADTTLLLSNPTSTRHDLAPLDPSLPAVNVSAIEANPSFEISLTVDPDLRRLQI